MTELILELIIASLATYGLTTLVTTYDGFNGMFIKLRTKYPYSAFGCAVCLSTWLVVPIFIVVLAGWGYYLTPLAIIGIVVLLEKI